MEAMACGLPVIAKDAHGPAEIVDHGETGCKTPDAEAYILKARVQLLRDLGSAISPFNAFLIE